MGLNDPVDLISQCALEIGVHGGASEKGSSVEHGRVLQGGRGRRQRATDLWDGAEEVLQEQPGELGDQIAPELGKSSLAAASASRRLTIFVNAKQPLCSCTHFRRITKRIIDVCNTAQSNPLIDVAVPIYMDRCAEVPDLALQYVGAHYRI